MKIAKIALLVSDFEDGGVERNFTSLAAGLADLGVEVHFLVGNPDHPYLKELGQGVRIIPVVGDPTQLLRIYLPQQQPPLLLTGKLSDDFAALAVKRLLGLETRLVAAVGTPCPDASRPIAGTSSRPGGRHGRSAGPTGNSMASPP
jgi:hypothetical protein